MSSILTNRTAMSALATLRTINMNLDETSNRVATGLKVAKASDNAGYWSLATNLRTDNSALSTVGDAIGLGVAALDTAYNGLDTVIKVLEQVKADLVSARVPGADKSKINTDLDALKARLTQVSQASSFNGDNWLYNSSTTAPGTKNIISSFNRDTNNTISLNSIAINSATTVLVDTNTANRGIVTKAVDITLTSTTTTATTTASYFLVNANSTTVAKATAAGVTATEIKLTTLTSDSEIDGMLKVVESMLKDVQNAGTLIGANTTGAKIQQEFVKTLQTAHDKGISQIVDADMNEESTKLKALQTQEQLGLQALSIANAEAEKLLVLFR